VTDTFWPVLLLVLVFEYALEAPSQVFELPVSMSSVSVDIRGASVGFSEFLGLETFLTARSGAADTDVGSVCDLLTLLMS
jgi:hypothetical protein